MTTQPATTPLEIEPNDRPELRKDLRAMVGDCVAFSAMVGFGESYLPAFALELGYGTIVSGLIATVPMLAGAILQLVTPAAVGILRSHRRWVVVCAALQAASFLPLVVGGIAGELGLPMLFLAATLYWGFGMSTGPAWTAWATTLVPAPRRARFFGRRAAAGQAALVAALLAAGGLLARATDTNTSLQAFALLFGLALGFRLISASFLFSQSEPTPVPIGETRISLAIIARHVRTGGHARLLVFLLGFQFCVWIAAPYFTPYMLGHLKLSYFDFTLLTTSAFAARVVALPLLGRVAERQGARRVISVATFGIVPLPVLWLLSDSFWWLFALQLLSGAAWAGFELGTLLSFFERIPVHGQTSVLTAFNLANAGAIVAGSLVGALIFRPLEDAATGFVVVMILSTLARLAATPLLARIEDTTASKPLPPLRTLSARPSAGAIQRPILLGNESDQD